MSRSNRWTVLCSALLVSFFSLFALAGCGVSAVESSSPFISNPGLTISGHAHGGAFPIQQATITLMETQVAAGNNNTAGSTYGTAAKVLTTATSDAYGYFTFSNYTGCDTGQYVYAVVTGGQTVTGKTNNNVIQVGIIGLCDTALANPNNVNLFLSEPSTVATAYALGNFISISPNDGSGSQVVSIGAPKKNSSTGACTGTGTAMACTAAGLAHGFANAVNLVDSVRIDGTTPTGTANSTFRVSSNSQAIAPQAMVNALGNILQVCVDSAGVATSSSISSTTSDGTACGNLFEYASTPTTKPVTPLNTLQVALNMAMYPTNNVYNLFTLTPSNTFFSPAISQPYVNGSARTSCSATVTTGCISFTLTIFYTGTGVANVAGNTETIGTPVDLALDAADNVYVLFTNASSTYGAIDVFNQNGAANVLGTHLAVLTNPGAIALDNLGYAWVTQDSATGSLYGLSTSTGAISKTIAVPNFYPAGVATDLSNDVWVSRDSTDSNQSLYLFTSSAYASYSFTTAPSLAASAKRIQVDHAQNIWGVTSSSTSTATAFGLAYASGAAGATLETKPLSAAGGFGLAITESTSESSAGGSEVYFPLASQIDSASGTTSAISGNSAGSATTASAVPGSPAIDGAGVIYWGDNEAGGLVYVMPPSTGNSQASSTSLSSGTLWSFQPCYVNSTLQCKSGSNASILGMAVDSSGAMWYLSTGGAYSVAETMGIGNPTWPLVAYARGVFTVK